MAEYPRIPFELGFHFTNQPDAFVAASGAANSVMLKLEVGHVSTQEG